MQAGAAEGREFLLYRARVVAFTVGLALTVATSFFVMHRLVIGQLLRTSVEEPWQALQASLERDVFVLSALLAREGESPEGLPELGPRGIDPDRRVLAWVIVKGAREAGTDGSPAVIDRYAQEPEGLDFAVSLTEELRHQLATGSSAERTRVEGDAAIRTGMFAPELPVPDATFAGVGEHWLAELRPVLEHLDATVLPRLEQEQASGASPPGSEARLFALLEFYAALRTLVDDVIVPLSIGSLDPGEGPMPPPLEDIARQLGAGRHALSLPAAEQIEAWSEELRALRAGVRFRPARSVVVGAAFASPQLALATQLDRRSRLLAVCMLVLAGLMGVAVARRTTRPLGRILDGIARFSSGDLEHRIDLERGGELATLARDLDRMAERLAESERSRRLASMGLVVGGAAHELKNPVHALDGALRLVDRYIHELVDPTDAGGPSPERRVELATRILRLLEGGRENVDRMALILEEIRIVNRVESDPREEIDLGALTRRCVEDLRTRWEGTTSVSIDVRGDTGVVASASLQRIPQNLLSNALTAVEEAHGEGRGGRVAIDVADHEERVLLSVHDDGPGVEAAVRDRIFDLFFTTREVGRGTGLGLFLVHEITLAHGGTIRCESPGALGGATFVVELPRRGGES